MTSTARCKCGFPTFREARQTEPHLTDDAYSRGHRVHHDEWDANGGERGDYARRAGLPAPPPDLESWDLYLRLVKVEHALNLAGFSGFVPVGVDVAVRATMSDVAAPAALTEGGD